MNDILIEKIKNISKQFLCSVPLNNFDWQNIFNTYLSETVQQDLINQTVNLGLILKYPISIAYQKLFLKYILDKLENQPIHGDDVEEPVIHDGVYSAYGRLVAAGDGFSENYKHYSLGKENKVITLKESNKLISDGTTGLRTWQASLALCEWIIQNNQIFTNKNILELGSGIGLTGLVLKNVCSVKTIYLTDCHDGVLEMLCENVRLNLPIDSSKNDASIEESRANSNKLEKRCLYTHTNISTISILNLPWEEVTYDLCQQLEVIEKVIAADIVYDNELFQPLLSAVKCLKNNCATEEFIFACTERNPETLEEFLKLIKETFQHIEELPIPTQTNFLWPTDTPIKIYRFKD